jgi:phosphate transport system permease protein
MSVDRRASATSVRAPQQGGRPPLGARPDSRKPRVLIPGASLARILRRGDPFVWLTGSALGISLLLIAGLIIVILVNGLGFFWPRPLLQVTLKDGSVFLGEVVDREAIPNPDQPDKPTRNRIQLKIGNRDLYGADFKWIDEDAIVRSDRPLDALYVERREYGPLLATPRLIKDGDRVLVEGAGAVEAALAPLVVRAARDRRTIHQVEKSEVGDINAAIEKLRLQSRALDLRAEREPARDLTAERTVIARQLSAAQKRYEQRQHELEGLVAGASSTTVTFVAADGAEKELRTLDIFRVCAPNRLGLAGRVGIYLSRLWDFLTDDPRESNTEGGIFPAIFGTVMMVLLMSLMAVPFGVVAALYLREYAKQGALVRLVRIAVNNLAGVPSIVFGVFGLGFFVYVVGGSIDKLFFPAALPAPTFGTGGILWASLTLALLTVPVVIVAAEEALAAVPRSAREASFACGATKFQTVWRVVLPAAAPGILTGLILAMARGAGEVAPLMITGVVKLAAELPFDGVFPFFHLERKFMHLGFHIYDVGFQSPNVEAAKPMVYTTTVFLLLIVVLLNLTAIIVRNRLRKKYQTSAF